MNETGMVVEDVMGGIVLPVAIATIFYREISWAATRLF